MNEKIQEFDLKMKELGIDPNDFFVVSFYANSKITLQGFFTAELCKKLSLLAKGNSDDNGYIGFSLEEFDITLC